MQSSLYRLRSSARALLLQAGVLACAAVPVAAAAGEADKWPQQPIKLLVGYVPGGTTDSSARIVAQHLSEKLGQQVIIENKSGANSGIAAEAVAAAKPDGYTLFVATASNAINKSLPNKGRYDLQKDFVPVSFIFGVPNILVVPLNPPLPTLDAYAKYAKANPGHMTFGSPGTGSSVHLAGELFKRATGADMRHVPYRGSSAAVTDLISGRIGSMFDNLPTALAQIQGGKVKALAIASLKRSPLLPDVPTFHESGYPGFEAYSWTSIVAPKGTPAPIVQKINLAMKEVLADPKVQKSLEQLGGNPEYMTPDAFRAFIDRDVSKWHGVISRLEVSELQ